MNKYLEKIAAKLHPELKKDIKHSIDTSSKAIYPEFPTDPLLQKYHKKYQLRIEGDLGHDVARDMLGHKYGKSYAVSQAKSYSGSDFIAAKRNLKDHLGNIPVSKRTPLLRGQAIIGRILRAKGR